MVRKIFNINVEDTLPVVSCCGTMLLYVLIAHTVAIVKNKIIIYNPTLIHDAAFVPDWRSDLCRGADPKRWCGRERGEDMEKLKLSTVSMPEIWRQWGEFKAARYP
jgi:hypothetical protein